MPDSLILFEKSVLQTGAAQCGHDNFFKGLGHEGCRVRKRRSVPADDLPGFTGNKSILTGFIQTAFKREYFICVHMEFQYAVFYEKRRHPAG